MMHVRKAVFVIRRLILVMFEVFVVVKRGKVCLVQRGKGCNVCAFTLCRFLSECGKVYKGWLKMK